jgi:hypothetical protein
MAADSLGRGPHKSTAVRVRTILPAEDPDLGTDDEHNATATPVVTMAARNSQSPQPSSSALTVLSCVDGSVYARILRTGGDRCGVRSCVRPVGAVYRTAGLMKSANLTWPSAAIAQKALRPIRRKPIQVACRIVCRNSGIEVDRPWQPCSTDHPHGAERGTDRQWDGWI